jgi:hypothetical protein
MSEMSPGAALRQLRQAHAVLKKARQLMKEARVQPQLIPAVLDTGWESLVQAHRTMASIPRAAVDEAVLTQQLSVQRYATALLVRLRRLLKKGELGPDDEDEGRFDPDDEVNGD